MILPTRSGQWEIIDNTTGGNTITVKHSGGAGVDLVNGVRHYISSDGTAVFVRDGPGAEAHPDPPRVLAEPDQWARLQSQLRRRRHHAPEPRQHGIRDSRHPVGCRRPGDTDPQPARDVLGDEVGDDWDLDEDTTEMTVHNRPERDGDDFGRDLGGLDRGNVCLCVCGDLWGLLGHGLELGESVEAVGDPLVNHHTEDGEGGTNENQRETDATDDQPVELCRGQGREAGEVGRGGWREPVRGPADGTIGRTQTTTRGPVPGGSRG